MIPTSERWRAAIPTSASKIKLQDRRCAQVANRGSRQESIGADFIAREQGSAETNTLCGRVGHADLRGEIGADLECRERGGVVNARMTTVDNPRKVRESQGPRKGVCILIKESALTV